MRIFSLADVEAPATTSLLGRVTGLDFAPDSRRIAVSTIDPSSTTEGLLRVLDFAAGMSPDELIRIPLRVRQVTYTSTESEPPPGTTMKLTEAFPNNSTIDGSLVFAGNDGRIMFDMVWTRKRQAGVAGIPLLEQWSEIGKPIEPIPEEVKKLEVFVGTRDVEFTHRPSLTVPQGSIEKGTMFGRWILDGRFLLGETKLPNFQSLWVIGYDTNKKAFRNVLFGSNGRTDENIGQWNEAERVFDWKLVNGPPELTRTSTTRRLDGGRVESHILAKTREGQTQMDLTIKATPRQ